MGASRYVGRVGGLAVALGVGAAMFSGSGLAWADSGSRGADSAGASSATDTTSAQSSAPSRRGGVRASKSAAAKNNNRQHSTTEVSAPANAPAASVTRRSAALAVVDPESATDSVAADDFTVAPPAVELPESAGPDIRVHIDPIPDPLPEPVEAYEVTAFLSEADNNVSDGADTDPLVPADSLASGELLAFVRRNTLGAASSNAVAPQVTSSATVTSGSLTVTPTYEFVDGIIQGNLNATSTKTLTYTLVGATCGGNCALGDIGGKISLGTVPNASAGIQAQSYTILPYKNWLDDGTGKGIQNFSVRVTEVTGFDTFLTGIPLVGMVTAPVIDLLQKLPLISDLLAPIIGASVLVTISPNVATLAPADTPVAYTYAVTSFDGVKISTNFFPKLGLAAGDRAPTVINMPGLASAGLSNPYSTCGICGGTPKTAETLGVKPLRDAGYNVVTVTPRGEFNSGGILQLDNAFFEGRDVSAVVDFIAAETPAALNDPLILNDPKVGMVGGSYGGGIQLVAAATDPRIDTIVPDIAWNSLNSSLYPDNTFKTVYASLLYLSLLTTNARVNTQIPRAILSGDLLGFITETAQAVLASSGPTALLNQLQAPTLLTQGIVDVLFPLRQSLDNAQAILGNTYGTIAKVIWFCGGHGVCGDPIVDDQGAVLKAGALAYLEQYVKGTGTAADDVPNFQWFDQLGKGYESVLLPYEFGFNDLVPIPGSSDGGFLPIVPILGGSNGQGGLYGLGGGSPASNAINVAITVGAGTQVVGAPKVSFDYQGIGTTRAVYAQVVNNATGQILGNVVTPLPVTLDGKQHTLTVDLSDIVYTYDPKATGGLTVQITSSASAYENFTSFGLMNISNVNVTMPNRTTV